MSAQCKHSSTAGYWLSHVSTSAYQGSLATLTYSPYLYGYVHNNTTTKHPSTRACSNELLHSILWKHWITWGAQVCHLSQPASTKHGSWHRGTAQSVWLQLPWCRPGMLDSAHYKQKRIYCYYSPQISLFSIIPEIVLATRSTDGEINCRIGVQQAVGRHRKLLLQDPTGIHKIIES